MTVHFRTRRYNPQTEAEEAVDTIVFRTNSVSVGLFRCRPWHTQFKQTTPAENHLLVLPRTSVYIAQAGFEPVVATPNVVMLYNQNQIYRREKVSEQGDLCEFFAFSPAALLEAHRVHNPKGGGWGERPFPLSHVPSDPDAYLIQRLVVEHILETDDPDALYVEEAMLTVLDQVVANIYRVRGERATTARAATRRAHAELAHETQRVLSTHFADPPSLDELADLLYCSPYHLCRVFRQQTGYTINQYLNQIRLRLALGPVAQGDVDLSRLALDLGYANHSHFTRAFRRAFNLTPSGLRRAASTSLARQMSKILTV
jgi:AraC-like DNA-binding protein